MSHSLPCNFVSPPILRRLLLNPLLIGNPGSQLRKIAESARPPGPFGRQADVTNTALLDPRMPTESNLRVQALPTTEDAEAPLTRKEIFAAREEVGR
jgi:hypothetical protein